MSFAGDLIKSGILTDGKNITVEGNVRSSNLLTTRGKIWYVHSGVGSDVASRGKLATKPFASLDYAIGKCVASRGDVIYCLPSHAETVATAGAIAADVIGISVIGLGVGATRPTFTFSTVTSTMTVSAASILLRNLLLKPSIDSIVSPIVVSAADCIIDVEVQDASATIECVNAILTTAAADRLTINLKYRGFIAGDACVNAVRLVGVDSARINVDFYGVASTAIVEFHTTACHDIDIKGNFYNDGTSLTKNIVDTVTGSTWSASGWDGNSQSAFSGGDGISLGSDDVSGLMGKKVSKATAVLAGTSTVDLFTVANGRVVVHAIVGEVTIVVQTQATSCKLISTPTVGTAADLCAALDLTADEVGCLYGITGLTGDALIGTNAGATICPKHGVVVPAGVIGFNNVSAANTGSVKWDIYYTPLDIAAVITSA